MLENLGSEGGGIDVGIDLGGADAFVAEKGLDDAEVGAAFEQGCGKGMTKGMGRDGLPDARQRGLLFDHNEDHHSREMGAPSIKKHIIFLSGLDGHVVAVVEPEAEFLDGTLGDGYEALLAALAHDAHELFVEVEVG